MRGCNPKWTDICSLKTLWGKKTTLSPRDTDYFAFVGVARTRNASAARFGVTRFAKALTKNRYIPIETMQKRDRRHDRHAAAAVCSRSWNSTNHVASRRVSQVRNDGESDREHTRGKHSRPVDIARRPFLPLECSNKPATCGCDSSARC